MLEVKIDTDVLIVGAGPVGLLLANECARRGLRFRIVETHASQSVHSKALAIFPRTLEILDMAGLVKPFLKAANRVSSVAVASRERTLARVRFAPEESPYPFIAMVPQNVTEQLLLEQLTRAGGAVEYETSFVSATERDDHVSVHLESRGSPSTLRASFVVGCDGAHSAVRHALHLPFEGKRYDASFMLADIETNAALVADELALCPNAAGPVAIFPLGASRARIVAMVNASEGESPTLELVQELLATRTAGQLEARSLHWSSYFRVHHRHVTELRAGRLFIAGDAAHIHSPFGGQGMNTGLHDVWNLAWKLDLVARGQAGTALLDSYAAERRPVIKQVIETTHRLTWALGTPSPFAQALRDVLIPAFMGLPAFQRGFVTRLSGLGIAYAGSPIVEGGGTRYFDDTLRGGTGLGRRFLLLLGRDADSATQQAFQRFADSAQAVVELRLVPHGNAALVRPDGYSAYQAESADAGAALPAIRSILARQLAPGPARALLAS